MSHPIFLKNIYKGSNVIFYPVLVLEQKQKMVGRFTEFLYWKLSPIVAQILTNSEISSQNDRLFVLKETWCGLISKYFSIDNCYRVNTKVMELY